MRSLLTVLLFAVILLELAWAWSCLAQPTPTTPTPEAVPLPKTSLALSPSEGTFTTGENFEVQIVLEAGDDVATEGVDVTLAFNPATLEVLDVSSNDFYPQRLLNTVDSENGTLRLALANTPDRDEVRGGGIVATVTFKPLQVGEASISFTDAIVADRAGLNILSQTSGGRYTIE